MKCKLKLNKSFVVITKHNFSPIRIDLLLKDGA